MKNKYKCTKSTVSFIRYHFIFCPRYRRKIFNIKDVERRFKELVITECDKQNIEILTLECHIDYVHIFVSVLPTINISNIMRQIKHCSSLQLRKEIPQLKSMPSLWTRNYFVSTENIIDPKVIEWYVNTQKTRP